MTKQQNKWSADAEMSMRGFVIPVESRDHLLYMVRYCLKVLKSDIYRTDDDLNCRSDEIVADAIHKYNSDKDKSVKHFVVNDSAFGVLMTFVRSKGELTLKSGKMKSSGVLAWVENIDAPQCSELGYVYFQKINGKVTRIG